MGGEVEGVSCEIKCMLKCGGLLALCAHTWHASSHVCTHNATNHLKRRRNIKEVEGLSCMDKCMFLCGLTLTPQKTCTDRCLKKCHKSYVFPSQLS
ncbi:hypothetical protein ARALYDRAFT_323422 [Arabidopsis lyrata subsp. lyrata]|uniref:Uncharacterized protein n=1 Tax=Arabidopsis lyrata subsp. lyrata TaxID=81972 RepID=D7LRK0_ARALL|nr:hypothetical protein ARALYDRAFT_323422 [Arabidopsis lyrata subsp. lyrata]